MKYFKHSKLDDDFGTGISVSAQNISDDEIPKGYLPVEINYEEFLVWKARIAASTTNTPVDGYYAGVFPGIGVVDKDTREALDIKQAEGRKKYAEKLVSIQVAAQRINFKLAQRDAETIGEDHEAVFTSKHPMVNEDVKAILFAEVRAAASKKAK